MPNFLWTAQDNAGKSIVREISAGSGSDAQAVLLAEGCTDLKLIRGEIEAIASEGIAKTFSAFGEPIVVTPEKLVETRGQPSATFWRVAYKSVVDNAGSVLVLAGMASYEFWRGNRWVGILLLVLLSAFPVFYIWWFLQSILFAKLHKAADWHRWKRVLGLVTALDGIARLRPKAWPSIPGSTLARFRIVAVAGQGHLEEALREFQCLENQPGYPSWLHTALTAGIYDIARQNDKAIELVRKAIEMRPGPELYIDLAGRLARFARDPAGAREALNRAGSAPLTDTGELFRRRCLGMVEYLEGDDSGAARELEAVLQLAAGMPRLVFRDGITNTTRAYLCCALARQGEVRAARKQFAAAKRYLKATGATELIAECKSRLTGKNETRL
jgi:hypothetical protein